MRRPAPSASSWAALSGQALPYQVLDTTSGAVVQSGTASFAGPVTDWRHAAPEVPAVYWTGSFDELTRQGQYVLVAGTGTGGRDFGYRSDEFVAQWPNDWRIMEQWLPHSTWFLFATAIGPTG